MRLGIITPLLTRVPATFGTWEDTASFADVVAIVEAADRLGYHHITCSEHVAIPDTVAEVHGGRYWDPLATFGFLAARTMRIRFATHVLVLGYHHPLEIAKRYGTLDQVSGGRLILGLGVGSLEEEFDLLGAEFDDRGARADDSLRALRASFGQPRPTFHGTHHDFEGFVIDPSAVQQQVPLWIGGRTYRSLRRAVDLGDGWVPFGLRTSEQAEMLGRIGDTEAWSRRMAADGIAPFEIVMERGRLLDPTADPDGAADALRSMADAGATIANLRFVHRSADHYLEQLEAMAEVGTPIS